MSSVSNLNRVWVASWLLALHEAGVTGLQTARVEAPPRPTGCIPIESSTLDELRWEAAQSRVLPVLSLLATDSVRACCPAPDSSATDAVSQGWAHPEDNCPSVQMTEKKRDQLGTTPSNSAQTLAIVSDPWTAARHGGVLSAGPVTQDCGIPEYLLCGMLDAHNLAASLVPSMSDMNDADTLLSPAACDLAFSEWSR